MGRKERSLSAVHLASQYALKPEVVTWPYALSSKTIMLKEDFFFKRSLYWLNKHLDVEVFTLQSYNYTSDVNQIEA